MSTRERTLFLTSVLLGLIVITVFSAVFTNSQLANDDVLIAVTGQQTGSSQICCPKAHGAMHPATQIAARYQTFSLLDMFKK